MKQQELEEDDDSRKNKNTKGKKREQKEPEQEQEESSFHLINILLCADIRTRHTREVMLGKGSNSQRHALRPLLTVYRKDRILSVSRTTFCLPGARAEPPRVDELLRAAETSVLSP